MKYVSFIIFLAMYPFLLSYFYFLYKLGKEIGLISDFLGFFSENLALSKLAWQIFIGDIKSDDIKNAKYFKIVCFHLRFYPVIFFLWVFLDAISRK